MKIGNHDITLTNVTNFIAGTSKKIADDIGFIELPLYQRIQVNLRAKLCSDCLKMGKCLGSCKCKTPDLFYAPNKVDSRMKWGKMLNEIDLENFMKINNINMETDILTDVLTDAYSHLYKTNETDTLSLPLTKEQSVKNLGNIDMNTNISQFVFTNDLNMPLTISKVVTGCGCTVPAWTDDPVNPGENFTIDVAFTPQSVGAFFKTISVIFTNPNILQLVLAIEGIASQTEVEQNIQIIDNATNTIEIL